MNRKQKKQIFIHSFLLPFIKVTLLCHFSRLHYLLVIILGTGDEEGNETDKILILISADPYPLCPEYP